MSTRRYLVLAIFLLAVVIIAAVGYWLSGKIGKSTDGNLLTNTSEQEKCLARLNISRDDNYFGNKNFGDKVKVDDPRFGELTILDATKPEDYAKNGGEQVGKLKKTAGVDYRDAALYLVQSQILKTYWHLGSRVCLSDENGDKLDTVYAAHFTGTHEFCTNECETGDLDFRVLIEKDSGFIYLAK